MQGTHLKTHNPLPKEFRRFATVVALASLTWCALFVLESDYLFKPDSYLTDEFADGPSYRGDYEWRGQIQNLQLESKNETSSKPLGHNQYNTTSNSNVDDKETNLIDTNNPSSKLLRHKKFDATKSGNEFERKRMQFIKSVWQNQQQPTFPRTVTIGTSFGDSSIPKRAPLPDQGEPEKHPILDEYMERSRERDIDKLDYYLTGQGTEDFQTHCVDMKEWQSKSYPVCNSMHELGVLGGSTSAISEMEYIKSGSFRMAHLIPNHHAVRDSLDPKVVVIKFFHLEKEKEMPFDPRAYEMHRVDALISERMTASPYVVDIYGYCGTSSVYEQGISNLEHDLRFRKGKNELKSHPPLADATKALYASQVAQALLDLHGLDYPENRSNTTIVHADIKPDNVVMVRRPWGVVAKLGDFNNSFLRKWNITSNSPCPLYMNPVPAYWGGGYMPPEQSAGKAIDGSVDVFAFGAMLYYLLVGKIPREQYPKGKEEEAIASGQLPPLPPPLMYGNTTHINMIMNRTTSTARNEKERVATLNNGDAGIINDMIKTIETHMKVRPEDRPPVELANSIFESYNTCVDLECSKSHW
mmetsp:Transcript_9321/g.23187  ORF Transcript_9321/g.23187 Transcript_9321/m.23187 type:complete len:583 (+) Transcript_9321:275-2023(+)